MLAEDERVPLRIVGIEIDASILIKKLPAVVGNLPTTRSGIGGDDPLLIPLQTCVLGLKRGAAVCRERRNGGEAFALGVLDVIALPAYNHGVLGITSLHGYNLKHCIVDMQNGVVVLILAQWRILLEDACGIGVQELASNL